VTARNVERRAVYGAWLSEAACRGSDIDFIETAGNERALAVCASCPVRAECLDAALRLPVADDFGVMGGTVPAERRRMRRAR